MNYRYIKKAVGIFLFAGLFLLGSCSDDSEDSIGGKPDVEEPGGEDPDDGENEIPEHNTLLGSLCGFEGDLRKGKIYKGDNRPTTYYNIPLFEVYPEGTEEGWWDNLVEEIAYSGLDYITANCRGLQPSYPDKYVDHGDPTRLHYLVDAMERRGVTDKFKIALFDDCPASWEAARNEDLGRGYAGYDASNPERRLPYPLKNIEVGTEEFQDSVYQYIWDHNLRLAFQNVPEKYLFKYNGRPVVFFWGCSFVGEEGSVRGKLVYILDQIRADCMKEFGMDPLLIIDQDWTKRDPDLSKTTESLGGVNNWFNMDNPYTVRTFKDLTVGVGVPGFLVNDLQGNKMFLDADHGRLLEKALSFCIRSYSDLILLEGFTDVLENAAYWRSTDKVYYDFPNQRLNIIRKWSSDPYPKDFKVETEACDYFEDKSSGNSGNQYRKGDLDIKRCEDTWGGWCVTDTEAGERLEWVELPFSEGQSVIKLRYAANESVDIRFDINEVEGQVVKLPATGGTWKEMDVTTVTFDAKGWRKVVLNIVSGNVDLNFFTISSIF